MQFLYNPVGMRAVNAGKYALGRLEAGRGYRLWERLFVSNGPNRILFL